MSFISALLCLLVLSKCVEKNIFGWHFCALKSNGYFLCHKKLLCQTKKRSLTWSKKNNLKDMNIHQVSSVRKKNEKKSSYIVTDTEEIWQGEGKEKTEFISATFLWKICMEFSSSLPPVKRLQ